MIKVCGMCDPENIRALSMLSIDLIGGIFYKKSPRYIGDRTDTAEAFSKLPKSIIPVGVFVNESIDYISEVASKFNLGKIQLHGSESPEFCQEAQKIAPVIKAFGLSDQFDFSILNEYESTVDLFVFDTSCKEHGGSGKKFNWEILSCYKGPIQFLLSGGIGKSDAGIIKQVKHQNLAGFDLNSGFEISPGKKDISALSSFLSQLS